MGRGGERYGGSGAAPAGALNAGGGAPGGPQARAPPAGVAGGKAPGKGAHHHRRRSSGSAVFKAEHLEVLTLFHTLSLFCKCVPRPAPPR